MNRYSRKKSHLNRLLALSIEGDGGGAGETGGNDAGNEAGKKAAENNKKDNLPSHDDMWNDAVTKGDEGDHQPAQKPAQQPDANEAFSAHVDKIDFASGVDVPAAMAAIRDGDTEAFGKMLQQVGANSYKNSLMDANKVVQQSVEKMSNSVKSDVSNDNASAAMVNEMNEAMPFTKSPAYAPIAKLTLTQFINKGMSKADAIKEVGKYFHNLSGAVSGNSSNAPNGRPSGRMGGNANQDGKQDSGTTDWMEMLGGVAE